MLMDIHIGHDMQTFSTFFLITLKRDTPMSNFSVGHQRSCFDSLLKFSAGVNLLVLETFFLNVIESVLPYYLWLCRFADWAVYRPVNDMVFLRVLKCLRTSVVTIQFTECVGGV